MLKVPGFAYALLREKLPAKWARCIDGPPELLSESFIDKKLKHRIADAVLRVPLKGGGKLVVYVIIEHKRTDKPGALFQVGQYVLDLQRHLFMKYGEPVPPVAALILYNGQRPWQGHTELHQLIDRSVPGWEDSLNFKATVIDVGRLPRGRIARDTALKAGLLAMKAPAVPLEEIAEVTTDLWRATRGERELRATAARYLLTALPKDARGVAVRTVRKYKNEEEPDMESIADYYVKRGEKRGEKRGVRKATEASLRALVEARFKKLPDGLDARLKRASLDSLQQWFNAALTAKSVSDVFN